MLCDACKRADSCPDYYVADAEIMAGCVNYLPKLRTRIKGEKRKRAGVSSTDSFSSVQKPLDDRPENLADLCETL